VNIPKISCEISGLETYISQVKLTPAENEGWPKSYTSLPGISYTENNIMYQILDIFDGYLLLFLLLLFLIFNCFYTGLFAFFLTDLNEFFIDVIDYRYNLYQSHLLEIFPPSSF
jgi:hypothetical protein